MILIMMSELQKYTSFFLLSKKMDENVINSNKCRNFAN